MTLSVKSVSPTVVTLSYTIIQSASTGAHNITLTTVFGTSTAVGFNVGDPTPAVTSVTPSVWPAGQNISVTIGGKGFGTNPSVVLVGTGVSVVSTSNPSDTSVQATISVAANTPNETVTVQVQSNGYFGSGYIATTQGQSPIGSNTANVMQIPAAKPQIIFFGSQTNCTGGTNITGTQSVVVGQEVSLCASYTVPQGLTVIAQSWSQPSGTVIGGYNASATSGGAVVPLQLLVATTSLTFYWVDTGTSRSITYSYSLSNGSSASATATFNVTGPTGATVTATTYTVNIANSTTPILIFGIVP